MNREPDDAGRGPDAATGSEDSAPQDRGEREFVAGRNADHVAADRTIALQALDSAPPRCPEPWRAVLPPPFVPPASPDPAPRRGIPPPRNGATHDDDDDRTQEDPLAASPTTATTPRGGAELLFRARDLAAVLRISVRTLWRLDATAKLPRPVRLGSACRWRRGEIEAWIAAGCPTRAEWDARGDAPRAHD